MNGLRFRGVEGSAHCVLRSEGGDPRAALERGGARVAATVDARELGAKKS
jgi:hypothetical protein